MERLSLQEAAKPASVVPVRAYTTYCIVQPMQKYLTLSSSSRSLLTLIQTCMLGRFIYVCTMCMGVCMYECMCDSYTLTHTPTCTNRVNGDTLVVWRSG